MPTRLACRLAASCLLAIAWGGAPVFAAPPSVPAAADAASAPQLAFYSSLPHALTTILGEAERDGGLRIIAFGEYHQSNAQAKKGAPVPALRRFSGEMFASLAPRSSDLVLETWITDGSCGKQETTAVAKVEKTTDRPPATESDLVTLVKQAKTQGVAPHILKLSCDDYKSILDPKGQVDFEKLLGLLTKLLHDKATGIADRRGVAGESKLILMYGGALHNDLLPRPELAPYTFGPSLRDHFKGRYLEVDLYVPEYIERDAHIPKEPWFALYRKRVKPGQTAVIKRAAGSYILVFSRRK